MNTSSINPADRTSQSVYCDKVRLRKEREQLKQIEPIVGESFDPHLPNDLDSVLIVDSYHEFREYNRMMQAVFRALRPGGRLVVIDGEAPVGRPRTEYHRLHTIPPDLVREELTRNGFTFKENRPGFYDAEYGKKMYFLVFEKSSANRIPENILSPETTPSVIGFVFLSGSHSIAMPPEHWVPADDPVLKSNHQSLTGPS